MFHFLFSLFLGSPVHTLFFSLQNWLRIARDELVDQIELESPTLRGLALAVGFEGKEAERHLADALETDTALVHNSFRTLIGLE